MKSPQSNLEPPSAIAFYVGALSEFFFRVASDKGEVVCPADESNERHVQELHFGDELRDGCFEVEETLQNKDVGPRLVVG